MDSTGRLQRTERSTSGRMVERPHTPAQLYALAAGAFLTALGVLALIVEGVGFETVGSVEAQPEFLVWTVSGWTTILWIAMGAIGLAAGARRDTAMAYAVVAGVAFAGLAVWGFVDGNDVAERFVAGTTNNVTYAVLGSAGLICALLPPAIERPNDRDGDATLAAGQRRFEPEQHAGRDPIRDPEVRGRR